MMFYRTGKRTIENLHFRLDDTKRELLPRRPLEVVFCWGNPEDKRKSQPTAPPPWISDASVIPFRKFIRQEIVGEEVLESGVDRFDWIQHYSIDLRDLNPHPPQAPAEVLAFLNQGYQHPESNALFLGAMRESFAALILETLKDEVLSSEEADYIHNLCALIGGFERPLEEENALLAVLDKFRMDPEAALKETDFDDLIKRVKEIHEFVRKNCYEGAWVQVIHQIRSENSVPLTLVFDPTPLAFDFAKILELYSPVHAIQALSILTEKPSAEWPFVSPFKARALKMMTSIMFAHTDTLISSAKDEDAARELRKRIAHHCLDTFSLNHDYDLIFRIQRLIAGQSAIPFTVKTSPVQNVFLSKDLNDFEFSAQKQNEVFQILMWILLDLRKKIQALDLAQKFSSGDVRLTVSADQETKAAAEVTLTNEGQRETDVKRNQDASAETKSHLDISVDVSEKDSESKMEKDLSQTPMPVGWVMKVLGTSPENGVSEDNNPEPIIVFEKVIPAVCEDRKSAHEKEQVLCVIVRRAKEFGFSYNEDTRALEPSFVLSQPFEFGFYYDDPAKRNSAAGGAAAAPDLNAMDPSEHAKIEIERATRGMRRSNAFYKAANCLPRKCNPMMDQPFLTTPEFRSYMTKENGYKITVDELLRWTLGLAREEQLDAFWENLSGVFTPEERQYFKIVSKYYGFKTLCAEEVQLTQECFSALELHDYDKVVTLAVKVHNLVRQQDNATLIEYADKLEPSHTFPDPYTIMDQCNLAWRLSHQLEKLSLTHAIEVTKILAKEKVNGLSFWHQYKGAAKDRLVYLMIRRAEELFRLSQSATDVETAKKYQRLAMKCEEQLLDLFKNASHSNSLRLYVEHVIRSCGLDPRTFMTLSPEVQYIQLVPLNDELLDLMFVVADRLSAAIRNRGSEADLEVLLSTPFTTPDDNTHSMGLSPGLVGQREPLTFRPLGVAAAAAAPDTAGPGPDNRTFSERHAAQLRLARSLEDD